MPFTPVFIRFGMPGIVVALIGISVFGDKVSKLICLLGFNRLNDVAGVLLLTGSVFVIGVFCAQAYRLSYDYVICRVKDICCCTKHNHRTKLKRLLQAINRSDLPVDAAWDLLKVRTRIGKYYDANTQLWAASVHLIYFTGIMLLLSSALARPLESSISWQFLLLSGLVVFCFALVEDSLFERRENVWYCFHEEEFIHILSRITRPPSDSLQ